MKLSPEQKAKYLERWEGKTDDEKRLAAVVTFGEESAEENFPELFIVKQEEEVGAESESVIELPNPLGIKRGKSYKVLSRAIGKVRWYNGSNKRVCGIVLTNNFGTPEASTRKEKLIEVEILRGSWKDEDDPSDGDWIVFSLKQIHSKYAATKATRATTTNGAFDVALQYAGEFSRIQGLVSERRGFLRYNEVIISRFISLLSRDYPDSWQEISRTRIRQYIERLPLEGWQKFIDELLVDEKNLDTLRSVYLPNDEFEIEDNDVVTVLIQRAIVDKIVAKKSFTELKVIPAWFGLQLSQEQAREFIDAAKTESEAEAILRAFDLESIRKTYPDYADARLLLPRRFTLYSVTEDIEWIRQTPGDDWKGLVETLKAYDDETVAAFITIFGRGRVGLDYSGLISPGVREKLLEYFCSDEDNSTGLETVISCLAEVSIKNDLTSWVRMNARGLRLSSTYLQLVIKLNECAESDFAALESFCDIFVSQSGKDELISFIDQLGNKSDQLLSGIFAVTGEIDVLNSVGDAGPVRNWLVKQSATVILKFLSKYAQYIDGESLDEDPVLAGFDPDKFADAVETLPEDERYQFAVKFPKELVLDAVCKRFAGSQLFDSVVGEEWNRLKSSLPYAVFDLESDGQTIKEFAFIADRGVQSYIGEEQLNVLFRALKRQDIIVGHNIKKWDLDVVLANKGFSSNAFVWDTLEIEILLNPCRYAYSLHTTHRAKDDAELTDGLFWNQLLRLSKDPDLCNQLEDFLPPSIWTILKRLQEPRYASFFERSGGEFFKSLKDVDEAITKSINEVAAYEPDENVLIVAPQSLWGHIAKHVDVCFPYIEDGFDYFRISSDKLSHQPLDDQFQQTIIRRFVASSKTPIVGNIAQYLRVQYFSNERLRPYVVPTASNVQCVDVDMIDKIDQGNFKHIYFIGCELGNRLHQYALSTEYAATDFFAPDGGRRISVPLRLASASYTCLVNDGKIDERKEMDFEGLPSDAMNVWVERTIAGKYRVCYSIDYDKKIRDLESRYPSAVSHRVEWTLRNCEEGPRHVYLVKSADIRRGFDSREKRVGSASKQKGNYWLYQLKLLRSISENEAGRPIVYVLDNAVDVPEVEKYAREIGFNISSPGSLLKRVEGLSKYHSSILVISRDQFQLVASFRQDSPLCYVFDEMAVDKCRMMWNGQIPFGDEAKTRQGECRETSIGGNDATPRNCLLAAWPIYEYYYRHISANSEESSMYVMDSYFEEYNDLSEMWSAKWYAPILWKTAEEYDTDHEVSKQFFKTEYEWIPRDADGNDNYKVAMDTIRDVFIPGSDWHPYQAEILPKILSRKTNCLISIPTGGGKSILFQGPALYNSMLTNRLSVVVTPLKALMEDQVIGLHRRGFFSNVDYINGDRSHQEIQQIYRKVAGGEIALLYVAPERFRSRAFQNALMTRFTNDGGWEYLIFDEAHCVSQWGQEFRPEYLHVIQWCADMQKSFSDSCIALYSATVTKQIEDDLRGFIGNLERMGQSEEQYNPIRNHIGMSFTKVEHDDTARIKAIARYVDECKPDTQKSRMLVFCRTRNQCEETAQSLANTLRGYSESSIGFFHAGMDADERSDVYEKFRSGEYSILCATKAFGMGMDIPNVHYIVHYSPPSVLEDYLQEVGRAGRDRRMYEAIGFGSENRIPARCLYSKEDFKKARDMLLTGNLSWLNLIEINKAIIGYIQKIVKTLKAYDVPVVIPNNLWQKEEFENDTTSFKIGMYWLERMGRIKMGYLCPAHLNVSLLVPEIDTENAIFTTVRGHRMLDVCNLLGERARWQVGKTVQVSLSELKLTANLSRNAAIDALIKSAKNGLIKIEQPAKCRVSNLRRSEVRHMFESSQVKNLYALHMIFEAARKMLAGMEIRKERIVETDQCKAIFNEVYEEAGARIEENVIKGKRYMPWQEESAQEKNAGLAIEENYKKDMSRKREKHLFTILEMLPGVKLKSMMDAETRHVYQVVTVTETGCGEYLDGLEQDCIKLLKKINDNSESHDFDWADAMWELGLDDKGFLYFEDVVRVLRVMGYVVCGSLLPFGVEVRTTPQTADELPENPTEEDDDWECWKEFDRIDQMRKLRLALIETFSSVDKESVSKFIGEYFKCVTIDDFEKLLLSYIDGGEDSELISALRSKAIQKEEERLGDEQRVIYETDSNRNVNVLAGPGSGKTHILTLRCAKLIYRQHVNPKSILALAYNRAVVVELRNRLDRIFGALGLSPSASQLNVYTFHGLAKKLCGSDLTDREMSEWEEVLLQKMRKEPNEIRRLLGDIKFIMIDEFQDITQTRLDAMFEFKKIYPEVSFFTIGDKNQSIYGFDKKIPGVPESTNPDYYYRQLDEQLHPLTLHMGTNYRSYQKILDAASRFLPDDEKSHMPMSAQRLVETEPRVPYVFETDNTRPNSKKWFEEFEDLVQEANKLITEDGVERRKYHEIALFFRTNAEVFRGYSKLRGMNLGDVRIRVQGVSACELWRTREIFAVVQYLRNDSKRKIEIADGETEKAVREFIEVLMNTKTNWDRFYLDFAYTLVLNYLEFVSSEESDFTYGEMADAIVEATQTDDGQLYKIYERYASERIDKTSRLNIVLTTMHKVKGLEFDVVVITPSHSALPLHYRDDDDEQLTNEGREELLEERRLMYVAYTRARKCLRVYTWKREEALAQMQKCHRADQRLGYADDAGIGKLFLGYLATERMFCNNAYAENDVARNSWVELSPQSWNGNFKGYRVLHNGNPVGWLSRESEILRRVMVDFPDANKPTLSGCFVNDIFVWTLEDSRKYDEKYGTRFTDKWCQDAINRGYVYLVDFAGYAQTPRTVAASSVQHATTQMPLSPNGSPEQNAIERLRIKRANRLRVGGIVQVRGMSVNPSVIATTSKLKSGDKILFKREPNNSWDKNAILALTVSGMKIGYVQKEVLTEMAPKMDAGWTFVAEFTGTITSEWRGSTMLKIVNANDGGSL